MKLMAGQVWNIVLTVSFACSSKRGAMLHRSCDCCQTEGKVLPAQMERQALPSVWQQSQGLLWGVCFARMYTATSKH